MAKKRSKKINWKKLLIKGVEEGIKKTIELIVLAIILGATLKLIMVVVPAVAFGAVIAKFAKINFLE